MNSSAPLSRATSWAGALGLCILWLCAGCGDSRKNFERIALEHVNDSPYLLLDNSPGVASNDTAYVYGIYRPKEATLMNWEVLVHDRIGPVLGTYAYTDAEKKSWFGVLHPDSAAFYNFDKPAPEQLNVPLDFSWQPETGVMLDGTLYLFGCDMRELKRATDHAAALHVARYERNKFVECSVTGAPKVHSNSEGMFLLKVLVHAGKVQILWRSLSEPTSGFSGVNPYKDTVCATTFDGAGFTPVRELKNLPQGYLTAFSDGRKQCLIIQPTKEVARTPALKAFELPETGEPVLLALPPVEKEPLRLRFKYLMVEPVPGTAKLSPTDLAGEPGKINWPVFARTDSQSVEFWQPQQQRGTPDTWSIQKNAVGLPQHELQSFMKAILAACLGLVLLGLVMAFSLRRRMRSAQSLLRPRDVLAPPWLRASAYLVDLFVLVGVYELIGYGLEPELPDWKQSVLWDTQPLLFFFFMYTVYMTGFEAYCGATPGKLLLGLRVVSDQGKPINFWSALARNLSGFFERNLFCAPIICLPMMLLTPKGQRMGDLLARTMVVQKAALEKYLAQKKERDEQKKRDEASVEQALLAGVNMSSASASEPPSAAPAEKVAQTQADGGAPASNPKNDPPAPPAPPAA